MKILYLSNPYMADNDFPLIKALQLKGIDLTVLFELAPHQLNTTLFHIKEQVRRTEIILASTYPELKAFECYMDMSKVYVSNRTTSTAYSYSFLKESFLLRRFIKQGNYDLVHAINFLGSKREFLYRSFSPWLTTVHDPLPHSDSGDRRKKDRIRVKLLGLSDGVIILNKNQKQEFCTKYNVPEEKVLVNKLGVYECMNLFVPNNVVRNPYNILFFGNIRPYKGLEYLCEAMRKVRQVVPQATLTIAGSGKLYFDIEPYLDEGFIELQNRYISMEELAVQLAKCSLCVCPYTDATQSGVIMTAYSMHVPVVATNVGGLSEMVEDGKHGLLVPPRDSDALAEAIISLLKDQERLKSFSKNIQREYFEGEQSWGHIADKYIAFYQQMIDKYNKK